MLVNPNAAPVAPSAFASCFFDIPATVVAMAHPLRAGPDGSAHRLAGVNQQRRRLAADAVATVPPWPPTPVRGHPRLAARPDVALAHRRTSRGWMRSRMVGTPREGVPEVVAVPGLAVADYLQPAL